MDLDACVAAVQATASEQGYRSVIWLRHWQDPPLPALPPGWIVACNGHRSNPWFLDALRTLLELSDGLASNAFGTHLGYGVALGRRLLKPQGWLYLEADKAWPEVVLASQGWQRERYLKAGSVHAHLLKPAA